jgi:hypothetical protein
MVRLSIELGLNHDPTTQSIFDESECQLRIRLWGIVLVHDRGTSLLLGRPLAIAPNDTNTPHPMRAQVRAARHERTLFAQPSCRGDPGRYHQLSVQPAWTEWRCDHARMQQDREEHGRVPPPASREVQMVLWWYNRLVAGRKDETRAGYNRGRRLTLLKIGIARILLLRALFSNKDLDFTQRHKALLDGERIRLEHTFRNIMTT